MNYRQTIDYLFARLPMFSRIGAAAYKPDLDNTIQLCAFLGNPQTKFKSVHIAGTNGKGSVSHMLAAVLQSAGYRTGLYTSPHLRDFRERIKVNGGMISEDFVITFTEKVKPLIEKMNPSFFEITVGMAFEYFAHQGIDVAVVETGLGGRLDSTNIIIPELSVITNIGWDHTNILGDSLEKIAAEKAGIIKDGVPVVVGEILKETLPVFEKVACEKNAPLSIASQKRQVMEWKWEKHDLVVEIAGEHSTDHKIYRLGLPGLYQTKNLVTVLEACSQLQAKGFTIGVKAQFDGLRFSKIHTGLHGRWEIIQNSPLIILDVAHNEGGIKQVLEQAEVTDHHKLHIILGMVKDKETDRVLKLFPGTANYYFTQAQIPRALPAEALQKKAEDYGLNGKSYPDVNTALKEARSIADPKDMILVCGSVFLVAEVNY